LNIYFSDLFRERVTELSDDAKKVLKNKLALIIDNPRHPSLMTKKIKGHNNIFEASIAIDIRMTWEYYEDGILLRNIGEHYKTLKNP
jgi:mRNA interferase RelE/StbE